MILGSSVSIVTKLLDGRPRHLSSVVCTIPSSLYSPYLPDILYISHVSYPIRTWTLLRAVNLTTNFHLVTRFGICGALLPLSICIRGVVLDYTQGQLYIRLNAIG